MPHGVSVISGRHVVRRDLRLTDIDPAHFAEGFRDDRHLFGCLDDLHRIDRDLHHGRHTIRLAQRTRLGQLFPARGRRPLQGASRIVGLFITRLQQQRVGGGGAPAPAAREGLHTPDRSGGACAEALMPANTSNRATLARHVTLGALLFAVRGPARCLAFGHPADSPAPASRPDRRS